MLAWTVPPICARRLLPELSRAWQAERRGHSVDAAAAALSPAWLVRGVTAQALWPAEVLHTPTIGMRVLMQTIS